MATTQYTAANMSAVSSPVGPHPAQPVDDEVEHQGVGDVQRQRHRPGMAQQLDRASSATKRSASHEITAKAIRAVPSALAV